MHMNLRCILSIAFLFILCETGMAKKIKVACVGNSITYGARIENRGQHSYPAQLQRLLGENYEVQNFGRSATTLLKKGDFPYVTTEEFKQSLLFNPDVVLIKLGTNDTKPKNRLYMEGFKADYVELVETYRNLPSHPRVILLTPIRSFIPGSQDICDSVIQSSVIPVIEEIAYEKQLDVIHLHRIFGDVWDKFMLPDKLHPSAYGAGTIAQMISRYLLCETAKTKDVIARFPMHPERRFNFHGYEGFEYNNKGVTYRIVKPHRVAKGNPWIWRTRFWDFEPQTDIAMLENGFHLVYCEVGDLFGSPRALERFNTFYSLLTKAGLHKKAVLEGMSRGGLIVYNWAAQNPQKVACIYADAPVMDIKSWPMGLPGDPNTKNMLSAYGFANENEAREWKGNPLDHVQVLAKANIPMLHVVGDADTGVPIAQNTTEFEKRLSHYGRRLEVIHKPGVGHHPHSLVNPEPIVSFILEATGHLRKTKQ